MELRVFILSAQKMLKIKFQIKYSKIIVLKRWRLQLPQSDPYQFLPIVTNRYKSLPRRREVDANAKENIFTEKISITISI